MEPGVYREMVESQRTNWWFVVRRRFLHSWVSIRGAVPRDGRILEVGAGTGANLDTLRIFGRVTALEPNSFACDYISRHFDVETVRATLPDGNGLRNFHLIVALDVLEHIDDDLAALRAMHGMLRERGRVILTVPAFQFLWSAHDERLHHKRRYRAAELVERMEHAGFRIVHRSYFNFLLFPAAAAIRLLDRLVEGVGCAGNGNVHPLLNGLMAGVFGMEVFLSRFVRFPFGLSLVVVGSRPA
ncbi:MAG: class I SAM-dependent methyltransferase, partial [Rhodospirillaceae bacterium]|nr:class I SAM-dependent methyltransferase [Rhodospirillaceae bacterium]